MAKRRMISLDIYDTDNFLDMPQSSQNLYTHLLIRADDEGFLGNPKTIMRIVGSSDDDLKMLITKNFIVAFKSGVIVIKDWHKQNKVQPSKHTKTQYVLEMQEFKGKMLEEKKENF